MRNLKKNKKTKKTSLFLIREAKQRKTIYNIRNLKKEISLFLIREPK